MCMRTDHDRSNYRSGSESGSGKLIFAGKAFSPWGYYSRHPEQKTKYIMVSLMMKSKANNDER